MTPQQKAEILAALESSDPTKVVTVALQICATLARNGDQEKASAIRYLIDRNRRERDLEDEFRRQRLKIAAQIFASMEHCSAGDSIRLAQELLLTNGLAKVPTKEEMLKSLQGLA